MSQIIPAARDDFAMWRLCALSPIAYLTLGLFGWAVVAGFVPPPPAYLTGEELQAHFTENQTRIRIGLLMALICQGFYMPFCAVISRLMQTIEGPRGPLSLIEVMGGVMTVWVGLASIVMWLTASFRPEARSPEIIQMLYDCGWFIFDTTFIVTALQFVAIAVCFLKDPRTEPLIPNWLCWFTLVVATMFVPLFLVALFTTGPFAWHGLINFYISIGLFFVWVPLFMVYVYKAVVRLEQERD